MKTQVVHQQYLATQVTTADRLQLVVMLYEGALGFLRQAREHMEVKDAPAKGRCLGRALDIIAELNASLNFQEGGELAANLSRLYHFMTQHLTRANLTWNVQAVEEVMAMLTDLKQAWEQICRQARSAQVSEPPAAPAGLTSGLGSLVV
ncbi:MAG: flagellar export chaperone FliS [Syntrophobacterales bacterium]|nr:flagellar export chaperone FliS [Syntrophobacterales bacterium]